MNKKMWLLGLLISTNIYALSLSVSPSTIPYNINSIVTYNVTNDSNVALTNAYLIFPPNFNIASMNNNYATNYNFTNATTCAIKSSQKGTLSPGASCKVVMTIKPNSLGTLEFSNILGISDQGSQVFPLTSSTAIKVVPSKIYYFGDSYTDIGCETTGNTVNYDKWPVYLNADLGLPVTQPDRLSGTDYACGGAETIANQYAEEFGIYIGLQDQIARFSININQHADPNALYFILCGGNDLNSSSGTLDQRTAPVVANTKIVIQKLQSLGAINIVVINQMNQFIAHPDSNQSKGWGLLTGYFNTKLVSMNNALPKPVIIYDLNTTFADMVLIPKTYGYVNVFDACDSYPQTCLPNDRTALSVTPFLEAVPGQVPTITPIAWFFANVHPNPAGYKFMEVEIRNYLFPKVY